MVKEKLSTAGLSWVIYFGNTDKESSNVDNDNFTLEKSPEMMIQPIV